MVASIDAAVGCEYNLNEFDSTRVAHVTFKLPSLFLVLHLSQIH